MYRFWLMAVSAGLASAAVFLIGVTAGFTGSYAIFLLVYLSPAPLYAAALGLTGSAGIVAALVGTVPVALALGIQAGFAYIVLVGAPAAVLGRQAMLSRRAEDGGVEWYPPGALAVWLSGVGVAILTLFALLLGSQPAGLSGTVREMLTQFAEWMQVVAEQRTLFVELLHPILPGAAVAFLMLVHIANAALAQGLLSAANREVRPTPDLGALELPGWIATAGAVVIVAAIVLGGDFGYFARNFVIIAAIPFFLQGLSVVHVLARRTGGGPPLLAVFYVTLIVFGWIAILLVLLGLVEQVVGLRRRLQNEDRS